MPNYRVTATAWWEAEFQTEKTIEASSPEEARMKAEELINERKMEWEFVGSEDPDGLIEEYDIDIEKNV